MPDSAIGVDGRTVRCAKCRHSWFQDGHETAQAAAPPPAEPPPPVAPPPPPPPPVEDVTDDEPPSARNTDFAPEGYTAPAKEETGFDVEPAAEPPPPYVQPDPEPEHEAAPPEYIEPAHDHAVDVVYEESPSSFAYEPPFRPRRNPARLWTAGAVAFALLAAALIGAVSWWGVPDWVPIARPTFGAVEPDLVLEFPPERQDRRTLPNGTEFFGASGTVTNVGQEIRRVPAVLIVLRDARERIVYTWEVRPPKAALATGESVTINEAVTDVPKSAKFAEIGWKP